MVNKENKSYHRKLEICLPEILPKSISDESPQIKLTPTILAKLRDASDVRNVLAKNKFSQDFTRVKDGRPYHSNKSDILEVIAPKTKAADPTEVVVRLQASVHLLSSGGGSFQLQGGPL